MTNPTRFINTGPKSTRKTVSTARRTTAIRRDIADIMRMYFSEPFTTHDGETVSIVGHAKKSVTYVGGEPLTSVTHSFDVIVTDKKLATIKYCDYNFREVKAFLTYECGETF